jgi:FAD/FMN-containing dehydrogenase
VITLPQHDAATSEARARIAGALASLGCSDVRAERAERLLYATDASIYQVDPILAVVPRDIPEAVRVVQWCAAHGIAVLPRGGGTSLNGQTVNHAVVVDLGAHCRGVTSVDPARRRAWVEPGVVIDRLNLDLAPLGLFFAPDPATSSHNAIGGAIGNNSAGMRSIMFGRTVENLHAVDVVLADGGVHRLEEGSCDRDPRQRAIAEAMRDVLVPIRDEIRARFPRILRHVDGYNLDLFLDGLERSTPGTFDRVNLAHVVCGSEGTLCTVVGAEVALVPTPKAKGLAIMGFAGVDEALAALAAMIATKPAAVELIDDVIIDLARQNREYSSYVELMPRPSGTQLGAVMYVEYFGQSPDEVDAKLADLRARLPGQPMEQYVDARRMAEAWKLRKAGEPLLHGVPGVRKPLGFVEDTAVDPSKLPGFIREFKEILARHGTRASFYAHASVGCLHIRPMLALGDAADRQRMVEIGKEVTDLVVRHGGALSGEHGSGRSRTALQLRYFGEPVCRALAAIKAIWDPKGLMNPGIKVDFARESMPVEDLRIAPGGRPAHVPATETFFTYEHEDGFEHAVEMCNGAGLCRKLQGTVTMCPSYQATLDERHSTRGRGNHLRLEQPRGAGDLGPVPQLQGLQERVSVERGHREAQGRVHGAGIRTRRARAVRGEGVRTCARKQPVALAPLAAHELREPRAAGACRAVMGARDRPAPVHACLRAVAPCLVHAARDPRAGGRTCDRAVPGLLHGLERTPHRAGRGGAARIVRVPRGAPGTRLLWALTHLDRDACRGLARVSRHG